MDIIQDNLHDFLSLFEGSISLDDLSKYKELPPVLHIREIAYLYSPDSKKEQELIEGILKGKILHGDIKPLSIEEWSKEVIKWKESRSPQKFVGPPEHSTTPK